jgi:hypothetical protein
MYSYLAKITDPLYIQYQREVFLLPIQNVVRICKQVTISMIQEVTSRLVTAIKSIYSSIQVRNVVLLTVQCIVNNFSFRYSLFFFVPEMPAVFTSLIVQIISIYFVWVL